MIFGYSIASAIAIYFVMWWVVLFAVLPFGVRTQDEDENVILGTTSSAPSNPRLGRKAIQTTIIATILFAIFVTVTNSGLQLTDIPLPGFDDL